jgi:hypothetical protein
MNNAFAQLSQFAKVAWEPAEAPYAHKAMRDVGYIGLAALGAGAAVRGAKGLAGLLKRRLNPPSPTYPSAVVTEVPIPVAAARGAGAVGGEDDEKLASITNPTAFPWYGPAVVAATGLGAYGGWKGVDSVLESQRRGEKDNEMSEAKKDFETALLSSYRRPHVVKSASAGAELGDALDQLFDRVAEKRGLDNFMGGLASKYLGYYALPTAAIAGKLVYDRANKSSRESILNRAMRQRVQRESMSHPSPLYAIPKPVEVGGGAEAAVAEDEPAAAELPGVGGGDASPFDAPRKRRIDFTGGE